MNRETASDDAIASVLQSAREATPSQRISFRDQLASFGEDALEPMAQWLTEPRLGAFAVRVLERIAREPATRSQAIRTLQEGRGSAGSPSIAGDVVEALGRLGAPVVEMRPSGTPGRAQRGHWAMHTWERSSRGDGQRAYVWSEIQRGRLRQGWGWDDSQDLRRVQARLHAGLDLTGWEADAWKARRMLTDRADAIQVDDLVIAVAVPEWHLFVVCRVIGPYAFDSHAAIADYGHILPIEVAAGPLDRSARAVGEPLHHSLNNRTRLWRIDHVGGDIEGLLRKPR
jgi:hypothetical protein